MMQAKFAQTLFLSMATSNFQKYFKSSFQTMHRNAIAIHFIIRFLIINIPNLLIPMVIYIFIFLLISHIHTGIKLLIFRIYTENETFGITLLNLRIVI